MTVYAFIYSECIHESGPVTMSLHRTKEGATKAMEAHLAAALDAWNKLYADEYDTIPAFGAHQNWSVNPVEVQD